MKNIADLLFEAKMLKEIPRSGYPFLGSGSESVAGHCFITTFIAYTMSEMAPEADALKLISMCLVHDLAEARTGDMNSVHKRYVTADEKTAVADAVRSVPFGRSLAGLIEEFEEGKTVEARLARDADQIAFVLDLKALSDTGIRTADKWLPFLLKRLQTETGKQLAQAVLETEWDGWWFRDFENNE